MKNTCYNPPTDKGKIIITGGHHNSALVVAQKLREKGYQVLWFGHKHTMRHESSLSAEYKEVTKTGFNFIDLKAGKFYKNFNPLEFVRIIFGFCQAFRHLAKLKPVLIISFGSYLAFPVILAGRLLKIPSVAHEQTSMAGLANKVTSRLVKKVFISWPSSKKHFPSKKTVFLGLPLRDSIFQAQKKFFFKNPLPIIFVTGGKQGSHIINKAIEEILLELLKEYNLIHQTGGLIKTGDFERLKKKRNLLPKHLIERYFLKDYFFEKEQASILKTADLIVSRAGAHIVYELAVLAKPAILIPISWSHNNEQTRNAEILKDYELAEILPENQLSGKKLLTMIKEFFRVKRNNLKLATKTQKSPPTDAADKMVDYCLKLVK